MRRLYRAHAALALALAACSTGGSSGAASNPPAPVLTMMPAAASGGGAPASAAPSVQDRPSGAAMTGAAGAPASRGGGGAGAGSGGAGMASPLPEPQAGATSPAPGSPQACAAMVAAARALIAGLDDDALKNAVLFPFERRRNFAYEPQVAERPGASLMMMSEAQREQALALVRAGLSDEGFKKAESVRMTENLKAATGFQVNMRDPSFYFLAIFGEPTETGAWAWQWEGHHLALHYTLSACEVADAPTFVGSWPAEVATTVSGAPPVGTRYLGQEEDLGRALAMALNADPAKRMQAIVSAAYRQVTPEGPETAEPATPSGLLGSAMNASEQKQLRELVAAYAGMMAPELAAARLTRIEEHGGFEKVSFVWSGALEPKQRHYYRVQGESFLIEYRNDDGNHIHTAWRDFTGEFGAELPNVAMP